MTNREEAHKALDALLDEMAELRAEVDQLYRVRADLLPYKERAEFILSQNERYRKALEKVSDHTLQVSFIGSIAREALKETPDSQYDK